MYPILNVEGNNYYIVFRASQGLVTAQIEKTKKDIEDEKLIKKGLQEALEESE